MVLNCILVAVILVSMLTLLVLVNKFTKNLEGKKGFWIKVFSNSAAISISPVIIGYVWAIGKISQITVLTLLLFSILVIILAFIFLVNLIGWKLKNRKVMMATSFLTIVILIANARIASGLILVSIVSSLEKYYGSSWEKLEQYKNEHGMYPQEMVIEVKNTKYNNFYYKTFNDGKDYVLHVAVGQGLWNHCSDANADACTPDKWFFKKDGSNQWLEIPDWFVIKKIGNSKNGKWSNWLIEGVPAKNNGQE